MSAVSALISTPWGTVGPQALLGSLHVPRTGREPVGSWTVLVRVFKTNTLALFLFVLKTQIGSFENSPADSLFL